MQNPVRVSLVPVLVAVASGLFFSHHAGAVNEVHFASFPDVSRNDVVFVYRDSIWTVPVAGGQARLLSDIGERPRHPKFDPSGTRVAYSATVDDNQEVFVVNLTGGSIQRLTYHPARDDMVDWHPDGESIFFKSTMQSPRATYNRLFEVDASGGLPTVLPLPYVETAAMSADGQTLYFSYLRDFQEEVWKRYLGGRAPDIWSYAVESGETQKLTDHEAPDSVPMLDDGALYFLSERGPARRSNIWSLGNSDAEAQQITQFEDADVRNPSIGEAGIVFELDGKLFLYSDSGSEAEQIHIGIDIARDEYSRKLVSLQERIESASVGPDGKIAFEARGDVLLYDTKRSSALNITNSSNAAERFPTISADNKQVAYQSDVDGEYQLYVRDLESGDSKRLTGFESGFRYRPFWSPDGRYLAFMDQTQQIWLVETGSGKATRIDQGNWRYHWDMPQFRISWSHDSRWFTYSRAGLNRNQSIYVYDVRQGELQQLTSGFYSDFDPVFDPGGNYIAAISYRNFAPLFGDIDSTFTYKDSMLISILPLTAASAAPGADGWQLPEPAGEVAIESGGAESRLRSLVFPGGSYSGLAFQGNKLSVLRSDDGQSELLQLELGKNETETVWSGSRARVLDATPQGVLVRSGRDFLLLAAKDSKDAKKLAVENLTAEIDPQQEFLQMFDDSWRYQRDFYYDPGLHGVDWQAARDHYRPLAAKVHSEQELTAVVRELHGELAAGHVYVSVEPPYNRRDATNIGLLGIDFAVSDGAYRISKILRPGVRRATHHSPLDDASLGVSDGDYILSVNGRRLTTDRAPWAPFRGLANDVVELTIASSADGKNSRSVRVKTLDSERKLRELVWVEETRAFVDEASNGRIGYIYVPNTGAEGQNELMQMYRAQYHKDALIVDERFNTGGALGDRFVELLNRPPLNYFSSRNANDYPLPELAHRGPKAMLINSWSYSGGDGFPFLFKTAGVGPLIGTRTWGGLIGPGMRMSLINGGFISAPPQRVYDTNGEWAEGNEGVRPNVDLQNNPGELARGNDQQLQHAINWLLGQVEAMSPVVIPDFPKQMPLPSTGE